MRQHAVAVAGQPSLGQLHGRRGDLLECRAQSRALLVGCFHRGEFGRQRAQRVATARHDLAPEQIERLDPGRSFVDGIELLIAQPRFGQVFRRVPVPSVNLDRERVRHEAGFRGKALPDRREEVEQHPADARPGSRP